MCRLSPRNQASLVLRERARLAHVPGRRVASQPMRLRGSAGRTSVFPWSISSPADTSVNTMKTKYLKNEKENIRVSRSVSRKVCPLMGCLRDITFWNGCPTCRISYPSHHELVTKSSGTRLQTLHPRVLASSPFCSVPGSDGKVSLPEQRHQASLEELHLKPR